MRGWQDGPSAIPKVYGANWGNLTRRSSRFWCKPMPEKQRRMKAGYGTEPFIPRHASKDSVRYGDGGAAHSHREVIQMDETFLRENQKGHNAERVSYMRGEK